MRVYHGTSERGARSIQQDGIRIDASCGGYYGRAFYVAEDREQVRVLAQLGEDEDGELVILELELAPQYGLTLLNLSEPDHWAAYQHAMRGLHISDADLAERMVERGIGAVRDINSMGGWAVYSPRVLNLITRE